MNMAEIRAIAQSRAIRPLPKSKLALVRAIQVSEGNFPCFGTASAGRCDQSQCLWREDCFKLTHVSSPAQ
ncbi:MAG: SAP domain-containing protein [Proteobacteria bacterium]|nr:MAG: SAP domain-containing protein [Pseudomonadota bacterium]QKK11816.1 MAG: SAP domain-containing protein [Pseudomonadota bacterium]